MAGPSLKPGQVCGIVGRRGGGKTLLATHFLWDAHKRGGKVLHNGALRFGESLELEALMRLDEKLTKAWIFLDEVQNLSDSLRSGSFVTVMLSRFLTQVRKRRCNVIWTAQDEYTIDRRLTWQTDIAFSVSSPDDGRTVYWDAVDFQGQFSPRPLGKPKRGVDLRRRRQGILRRADSLWPLYDTFQVIDPLEAMTFTRESLTKANDDASDLALLQSFSDWINALKDSGETEVAPGELALKMAESGFHATPEKVGKMLGQLGFSRKRSSQNMLYRLIDEAD